MPVYWWCMCFIMVAVWKNGSLWLRWCSSKSANCVAKTANILEMENNIEIFKLSKEASYKMKIDNSNCWLLFIMILLAWLFLFSNRCICFGISLWKSFSYFSITIRCGVGCRLSQMCCAALRTLLTPQVSEYCKRFK